MLQKTIPFPGFWATIPKPLIALSPMDGVTDFAFRFITAKHGRPDVMFTEFTTAEGLFYAPERILRDFEYAEEERPIVAQIYGHRPEDFYRATLVVCALDFDGIDINMGCPSKSVIQKNCGAGLIRVPDLALDIIRATRAAVEDWAQGQTLEGAKIPARVIDVVSKMNEFRIGQKESLPARKRRLIPYSVKTRLGYDSIIIESWVETLLSESPAVISIHGRTLKQMYKGQAQWDAIGRAVQIAQGSGTLILGNGDLTSLQDAADRIEKTKVDGILIGRSSIGNPWIFKNKNLLKEGFAPESGGVPTIEVGIAERCRMALEHANCLMSRRGERHFKSIRKHLVGYLRNVPHAATLRNQALQSSNLEELTKILTAQ